MGNRWGRRVLCVIALVVLVRQLRPGRIQPAPIRGDATRSIPIASLRPRRPITRWPTRLSPHCADLWLAKGQLCEGIELGSGRGLVDVIVGWSAEPGSITRPTLRYSLRSVRSDLVNRLVLLVPHAQNRSEVIIPSWLDPTQLDVRPYSTSLDVALGSTARSMAQTSTADAIVVLQDTMLLSRVIPGDLITPLLGPVLRFGPSYVPSAWLDQRFGRRNRREVAEGPVLLPLAALLELEPLLRGADMSIGSLAFMATHYHIERARETLLWSLIASLDLDQSGQLSWTERSQSLERVMQDASTGVKADLITIAKPVRPPAQESSEALVWAKSELPASTWLRHVSSDGFASNGELVLGLTACFGRGFFDISREIDIKPVVRRLAVEEPACGDALIQAGVRLSGDAGLAAFLPPERESANTSRASVVEQLQRWSYALGQSSPYTLDVYSPGFLLKSTLETAGSERRITSLRLNDRTLSPELANRVDDMIETAMSKRFVVPAPWEL